MLNYSTNHASSYAVISFLVDKSNLSFIRYLSTIYKLLPSTFLVPTLVVLQLPWIYLISCTSQ
jgi:hypothetical protein